MSGLPFQMELISPVFNATFRRRDCGNARHWLRRPRGGLYQIRVDCARQHHRGGSDAAPGGSLMDFGTREHLGEKNGHLIIGGADALSSHGSTARRSM